MKLKKTLKENVQRVQIIFQNKSDEFQYTTQTILLP